MVCEDRCLMSIFWKKTTNLVIPALSILFSLSLGVEAVEVPKLRGTNFNRQEQSTSRVYNRQGSNLNVNHLKSSDRKLLLTQNNTIDQIEDIEPTDWSYEALRDLIERYGCITGFPDRTFRGDRNVSRAEFAAGLNNCLNKVESLMRNPDTMPQADVDNVLRLMQEFQSDLAILQGRTDGSQARVGDLETTQFSTTSKLQGEAIFGLGSVLAGDGKTVFGSRTQLDFKTSFSGDDLLLTRLSNGNFPGFSEELGTVQGDIAFAEEEEGFELDVLQYNFSVGDKTEFILGATGIEGDDIAETINALDGDESLGSISVFGTRNPIYNPPGDAGLGIVHRPIEQIEISAGYLASPANEPSSGNGLFNGAYSALGQITIEPIDSLSLAATYVHSYDQTDTETGTSRSNLQSRTADLLGEEVPTVSNSYGLELSWAISDRIIIGGWGGLSKVSNLNTLGGQLEGGTQDIWNWAATLALPDLGKEGNLAGIVVGSEPKVTSSSIDTDNFREDDLRSLHLEAFYQYQVSDNIAITPGVVWITEPDTDTPDDDLVIGTIRTTFSF